MRKIMMYSIFDPKISDEDQITKTYFWCKTFVLDTLCYGRKQIMKVSPLDGKKRFIHFISKRLKSVE